jgi:hypothetical protein
LASAFQELLPGQLAEELMEIVIVLLALVRKLDDCDWLFPSGSWQNDVDLFGD